VVEYEPAGKGQKRDAHIARLQATVRQAKRARIAQQQDTMREMFESIRRLESSRKQLKRKRAIAELESEAGRLERARRSKQVREKPMTKVELAASQRLLQLWLDAA
jgi:hypothetical protein